MPNAPPARGTQPYAFLPELPRRGRGGTTQRVQEVIREAIVALAFAPGEFIQKEAICKRLGVSRFPVSEALGKLADEGFVEILPQRGTRVTQIDVASCRQAMFIRRALEGEAMRVIAAHAGSRIVERLEQSLSEQKLAVERGDVIGYLRLDIAFHDALLSELGFERVRAAVDAARGSLDRTRLFLLRMPQRQHQSYLEHVAIAAALQAADGEAAHRAMTEHLDHVMTAIELHATENPEIFAPAPRP